MVAFELSSDAEDNPYSLVAAAGTSWFSGQIRVEPPFSASQEWLDERGSEAEVELFEQASDRHSTMLEFMMMNSTHISTLEERVRITAGHIISELGTLASKDAFKRAWEE